MRPWSEYGYRIHLDAYVGADGASAVLAGVREALDVCTFNVVRAGTVLVFVDSGDHDGSDPGLHRTPRRPVRKEC